MPLEAVPFQAYNHQPIALDAAPCANASAEPDQAPEAVSSPESPAENQEADAYFEMLAESMPDDETGEQLVHEPAVPTTRRRKSSQVTRNLPPLERVVEKVSPQIKEALESYLRGSFREVRVYDPDA